MHPLPRTPSPRASGRARSSRSRARDRLIRPPTSTSIPATSAAQTTRTLQNVKAILDASGATFDDVVMLRVYLTKREDFAAMNDAYGEFVLANTSSDVLPCRTTVFTGLPREEMLVEIDAFAIID